MAELLSGAVIAISGIIAELDIAGIPIEVCSAAVSFVLFIMISLITKEKE